MHGFIQKRPIESDDITALDSTRDATQRHPTGHREPANSRADQKEASMTRQTASASASKPAEGNGRANSVQSRESRAQPIRSSINQSTDWPIDRSIEAAVSGPISGEHSGRDSRRTRTPPHSQTLTCTRTQWLAPPMGTRTGASLKY